MTILPISDNSGSYRQAADLVAGARQMQNLFLIAEQSAARIAVQGQRLGHCADAMCNCCSELQAAAAEIEELCGRWHALRNETVVND